MKRRSTIFAPRSGRVDDILRRLRSQRLRVVCHAGSSVGLDDVGRGRGRSVSKPRRFYRAIAPFSTVPGPGAARLPVAQPPRAASLLAGRPSNRHAREPALVQARTRAVSMLAGWTPCRFGRHVPTEATGPPGVDYLVAGPIVSVEQPAASQPQSAREPRDDGRPRCHGDSVPRAARHRPEYPARRMLGAKQPPTGALVRRRAGEEPGSWISVAAPTSTTSSDRPLLGHAHPALVRAVQEQVARGIHFFWLSEPSIQLAEAVAGRPLRRAGPVRVDRHRGDHVRVPHGAPSRAARRS